MENIVRKGEIAYNKQFLLFSQCFLPCMALSFHFKCTLKCCLQLVSIWTSLKFWLSGNGLTLSQTRFLCVFHASLLKTMSEKEKLLVTSNFFFSNSVFYSFEELSTLFIKLTIVVCKLFQFRRV